MSSIASAEQQPTAKKTVESSAGQKDLMKTILPYAIGILAQLPLLLLYYRGLLNRAHYSSWFWAAILVTAALAWFRWPKDGKQVFMESMWSNILAALAVIMGLAGVLFVEPWFAACSVYLLIASLLARTIDPETGKSLWVVAIPLFVSLRLPFDQDVELITTLQTSSANITSRLLDLANIGHHMPGTVIKTPDAEYGVEEACSGIQSFFLLVFVAVAYCVWLRRPLFRSLLLVLAAMAWAVFMNCLRIFLIPVFDYHFGIDLAKGFQHDLLGYMTMALGILLLLSTDQFLMFLFGPVDPGTGSSGPMGKFITKIWNNLISGGQDDDELKKRRRSRRKPLTGLSKGVAWATAGLLVVGGLIACLDIFNSFNSQKKKKFFVGEVVHPIGKSALPETVQEWELIEGSFEASERNRASDLGEMSERWLYQSPSRFVAHVSLDQTFPGWHELTRCYRNQGWKIEERVWQEWTETSGDSNEDGTATEWPYIEARLSKPTGESAVLLFSLFDAEGKGFIPPRSWNLVNHLISGAQNRIGQRVRSRLFQDQAYQTQAFVYGFGEMSKSKRDELTKHYLEIREIMRQKFLATKNGEESAAPEDEVASTN